eukprot:4900456-Pyramimonas_sp.AAC.1
MVEHPPSCRLGSSVSGRTRLPPRVPIPGRSPARLKNLFYIPAAVSCALPEHRAFPVRSLSRLSAAPYQRFSTPQATLPPFALRPVSTPRPGDGVFQMKSTPLFLRLSAATQQN